MCCDLEKSWNLEPRGHGEGEKIEFENPMQIRFWSGTEIFLFTVKCNVKFEKSEKFRIPSFHRHKTYKHIETEIHLKNKHI